MPSYRAADRFEQHRRRMRGLAWLALWAGVGCGTSPPDLPSPTVAQTIPASLTVPHTVQRLAVLYRTTADRDERDAYTRLEGAAFQLKELRSTLRIFERTNLSRILAEQHLQLTGPVSEETMIRVGRLLGVDSVLLYEIEGPSMRDRLLARQSADLPPLTVTSKIIRVESAEVLYHNVVTAAVEDPSGEDGGVFGRKAPVIPLIRAALARGVDQTIVDLRRAFR